MGFRSVLAIAVILGLAFGAGIGAWQNSSGANASASLSSINGSARGAATQGGAAQGASGQQQVGNRPTIGVVEKIASNEFSVKEQGSSSTVTVRFNEKTTFRKQEAGSIADLKQGERIVVRGEAAADGTVKAAMIQIGAESMQGGFGGFQGGQGLQRGQRSAPSGTPAAGGAQGAAMVMGTVESIDGTNLTVKSQGSTQNTGQAAIKVSVPDTATIIKSVEAKPDDLKEGTFVTVMGNRGADGVLAASSVQIMRQSSLPSMRGSQ